MFDVLKKIQLQNRGGLYPEYRTRCGLRAKIYSATGDNRQSVIHGAVFAPRSGDLPGGWVSCEWDPTTGARVSPAMDDVLGPQDWDLDVEMKS